MEIIRQIINNKSIIEIYEIAKRRLFIEGPTSITVLEILTYLSIFSPDFFENVQDEILEIMGVFYKNPKASTLYSSIFNMYGEHIKDKYHTSYTPVQANIVKKINNYKNFSFSAPTSTGKSYVFRNIIESLMNDVVIIVPSRALINEYYYRVCKLISDKTVNVLTFVDLINTKHTKRNVFILTPERARELFKFKDRLNIEIFLFDEAQLSNEDSIRGLYYDSIVRRVKNAFVSSKCIFAHPFVSNPEAQFEKNKFDLEESKAFEYNHKNVGQIYFAHEGDDFYHFGIEKDVMGRQKTKSSFDPMMNAIQNGKSILIYVTKASIYNKSVFAKFGKYLESCTEISDLEALKFIEELKQYIGADKSYHKSNMMEMLKYGIVIHHGSLPLQARLILEQFTQRGFCKVCFATSTLEQGINMPFDVVYLNTFEASQSLSIKNLIGRAGRSTNLPKFDYGIVIVKAENMSKFRNIMLTKEVMSNISLLDTDEGEKDIDYKDFKEAINTGEFSDEFNMPNTEVRRLNDEKIDYIVGKILDDMFVEGKLIPLKYVNSKIQMYDHFINLYSHYLNGRELSPGEQSVLNTAIKILLWKVHCKTFKDICWWRYSYVARIPEQRTLEKLSRYAKNAAQKRFHDMKLEQLEANFIRGYDDLPNNNLQNYSIYQKGTKAKDVDYDRIVFDTYDYLDKLIGFKLSDIFYAVFYQYHERTDDERALKLAKYFKYGTDNEKEILLLRYGLSFEEIEWVENYIIDISLEEIVFHPSIKELPPEKLVSIDRFLL